MFTFENSNVHSMGRFIHARGKIYSSQATAQLGCLEYNAFSYKPSVRFGQGFFYVGTNRFIFVVQLRCCLSIGTYTLVLRSCYNKSSPSDILPPTNAF